MTDIIKLLEEMKTELLKYSERPDASERVIKGKGFTIERITKYVQYAEEEISELKKQVRQLSEELIRERKKHTILSPEKQFELYLQHIKYRIENPDKQEIKRETDKENKRAETLKKYYESIKY